jgi:hypothetical protein
MDGCITVICPRGVYTVDTLKRMHPENLGGDIFAEIEGRFKQGRLSLYFDGEMRHLENRGNDLKLSK